MDSTHSSIIELRAYATSLLPAGHTTASSRAVKEWEGYHPLIDRLIPFVCSTCGDGVGGSFQNQQIVISFPRLNVGLSIL